MATNSTYTLPHSGRSKEEVLSAMRAARDHDVRWREGRAFSLVYNAGEEITDLLKVASLLFFSENGLNPTAFPSLKKFEAEVIALAAIRFMTGPVGALLLLSAVGVAWFYPLTRERHARIRAALNRRKQAEAATGD